MPAKEFPLSVVSDTERRLKQLRNSFVEAKVTRIRHLRGVHSGLEFGFSQPERMLGLPEQGMEEIEQLFEDVKAMGQWIREQHEETD